MHERIHLINHHGKQVLVIDLSNCSAVDVEKIVRAVPEFVTTDLAVQSSYSPISMEHRLTRRPFGP
jgi:hypothetical protein